MFSSATMACILTTPNDSHCYANIIYPLTTITSPLTNKSIIPISYTLIDTGVIDSPLLKSSLPRHYPMHHRPLHSYNCTEGSGNSALAT